MNYSDLSISSPNDITELDAVSLSRAIKSRKLSCLETLDAFLGQVESLNPRVNALVSLQPANEVRQQAQDLDAELARGEWRMAGATARFPAGTQGHHAHQRDGDHQRLSNF